MLLKSSLVAILLVQLKLIYASSIEEDKKSSPVPSERSVSSTRQSFGTGASSLSTSPMGPPSVMTLQRSKSSAIRIPVSQKQGHDEPPFLVPAHVQERRLLSSRMQSGESGIVSNYFINADGYEASPPDGLRSVSLLNPSTMPALQSFISGAKGSVPFPDTYSYHAIGTSNFQASSEDVIPVAESRNDETLSAARLSLNSSTETSENLKAAEVHSGKSSRKAKAVAKAVEKAEKDEQPSDRRRVTLDLFKGHSTMTDVSSRQAIGIKSSSSMTPNASSFRKSGSSLKDEKKTTYISALSEALQRKPEPPQRDSFSTADESTSAPSDDVSVPFDEWSLRFRLPSSMNQYNARGPFFFPRCETTDPDFEEQLNDFRTSLITKNGENLHLVNARDYIPFPDLSRPLHDQLPNRPVSAKPFKIFDAQPQINWEYVECSVLGMQFELVSEHPGRESDAGRKSSIQYVRSGPRMFVRKIYNSLGNFMNELKFFQKTQHAFIPRPICVEENYPSIVIEYVEGKRIHEFMYDEVINKYDALRSNSRNSEMDTASSHRPLGESILLHLNKSGRDASKTNLSESELRDLYQVWGESWDSMVRMIAKLMSVVKYIHSLGLIHCDIKPENVIYDSQLGRIMLIDFDLSAQAPFLYSNRGTATTVAPEVAGFLKGPVNFAADWWGFGSTVAIIASFALAGFFHCYGDTKSEQAMLKYVPFVYNYTEMTYTMTPIPFEFPDNIREFLYPFFSPIPAHRMFSEQSAFDWISSHPFFFPVDDIRKYSVIRTTPSIVTGFIKFSQNPILFAKNPIRKRNLKQNIEMLYRIIKHFKRYEEKAEEENYSERETGIFQFDEGSGSLEDAEDAENDA